MPTPTAGTSSGVFYTRALAGIISSWGAAAVSFFEAFNPVLRGIGLLLGIIIAGITIYKLVRDWDVPYKG